MKDPLQTIKTPYEILGIKPGASKPEINKAFMAALRRVPPNEAQAARDALMQPIKRAKNALLEYDDNFLKELTPCPLKDDALLQRANRMAVATDWESKLKKRFPDTSMTHSLAVFWYHWTLYEEQRFARILNEADKAKVLPRDNFTRQVLIQRIRKAEGVNCNPKNADKCVHKDCQWRQDCRSSAPSLQQMWQKVIAYWCNITATQDFWSSFDGLSKPDIEQIKQELISSLEEKLLEQLRNTSQYAPGLSEQYQKLKLILSAEERTARTMSKIGVRSQRGKVCCGKLLLIQMDFLDRVLIHLDSKIKSDPKNDRLKWLKRTLSPYSMLHLQLKDGRAKDALEEIKRLPAKEQKSNEVSTLEAQALFLLGKQQADLRQIDDALASWENALCCKCSKTLIKDIKEEIVSRCHSYAVSLSKNQRDEAITILEMALELVKDKKLQLDLGKLLAERGIDTLNKTEKQVRREKEGITPELMAVCENALADIERAAELGSTQAKDNLKAARGLLEALKSRLPGEAQELVEKSNKAAAKGDWDEAIICLRKAIKLLRKKTPDVIRRNLSIFLNARAVEKANKAGDMLKKSQESIFEKAVKGHGF